MAGERKDCPDDDEESMPPDQKKCRMVPPAEVNKMAVAGAQQPINHFDRTTDEIMVLIFSFSSKNLPMLKEC